MLAGTVTETGKPAQVQGRRGVWGLTQKEEEPEVGGWAGAADVGKDGADGKDGRNLFLMFFVCFILVWGLACLIGFSWVVGLLCCCVPC